MKKFSKKHIALITGIAIAVILIYWYFFGKNNSGVVSGPSESSFAPMSTPPQRGVFQPITPSLGGSGAMPPPPAPPAPTPDSGTTPDPAPTPPGPDPGPDPGPKPPHPAPFPPYPYPYYPYAYDNSIYLLDNLSSVNNDCYRRVDVNGKKVCMTKSEYIIYARGRLTYWQAKYDAAKDKNNFIQMLEYKINISRTKDYLNSVNASY